MTKRIRGKETDRGYSLLSLKRMLFSNRRDLANFERNRRSNIARLKTRIERFSLFRSLRPVAYPFSKNSRLPIVNLGYRSEKIYNSLIVLPNYFPSILDRNLKYVKNKKNYFRFFLIFSEFILLFYMLASALRFNLSLV